MLVVGIDAHQEAVVEEPHTDNEDDVHQEQQEEQVVHVDVIDEVFNDVFARAIFRGWADLEGR